MHDKMNKDNLTIIVGIATAITAFLFGQSGVFQKILDFFLGERKEKIKREKDEIEKKEVIIKELQEKLEVQNKDFSMLVTELNATVSSLEKDLIQTNIYLKTLLSYFKTIVPNGDNAFIDEMIKEIRK